jgi:hypothetical protein
MFPVSNLRQSPTTIAHESVTTQLLLPEARKLRENFRKKGRKKKILLIDKRKHFAKSPL